MSIGTMIYLAAMALMYVSQRMLAGYDELQITLATIAVVGLVLAAALRVRALRAAKDDGLRYGHRLALVFLLVGAASLVFYAATTDGLLLSLSFDDEGEARWLGVWRSLWPVVWLIGTVPLLAIDYAIESSPVVVPRRRVQTLASHGLVVAMGVALVFPANYVASQYKHRWDLAYFKTPTPGTATQAIAAQMEAEVHVRIFMPPSSEVGLELQNYFGDLQRAAPNLTVDLVDQAADPRLAKALNVRDNGEVTFTAGEVELEPAVMLEGTEQEDDEEAPKPITRRIKVNKEFDKAKRVLKKLDNEVQRILIELGHGARVAYVTSGHAELTWEGGRIPPDASIKTFKKRLKSLGFSVKKTSLKTGLGEKVPEDADVVLILGPRYPFVQNEVDSLRRYLESGGSVLIALEPPAARPPEASADPLLEFMQEMGIKLGDGVLASERGTVAITGDKMDRFNVATDSFTSHASVNTLAQRRAVALFTFRSGFIEEVADHPNKVTFTVRAPAMSWADLGERVNAEFDGDQGESKSARNIVAAVEGGEETTPWRAIVTGDSSLFADLTVVNHPNIGNALLLDDTVNWLIGAEALSGTTENEEDVKIEHTKEDQVTWFYLTILGIPLMFLIVGAARVRWRRRSSATNTASRAEGDEA